MRAWIVANRKLVIAGGVVVLGAFVFVLLWFQPQKLFIDVRVDEDLPAAAATPSEPSTPSSMEGSEEPTQEPSTEASPAPTGPVVVSREDLRLISHHASGVASLVRLPDGSSVIRFEELDVENGPDLRIYLSAAPADGPPDELDDDHVDLGALKGNQGNQNYPIPADVDLSRYQSVTIWCRRFSVGFAVAPIG